MKLSLGIAAVFILATSIVFLITGQNEKTEAGSKPSEAATKRPVLVELFTSEGCSSCPPADQLLTAIAKENPDAITLAYHVDYWDRLGWKDRFSSAEYSRRQDAYGEKFKLGSIYTPQMIVGGTSEFVGSNRSRAQETIMNAVSEPSGKIDLTVHDGKLDINVSSLPEHGDATVYLAVAENGLTTKVGSGENSGSKLEHSAVVRELTAIDNIGRGKREFKATRDIPKDKEWNAGNLKYVVFVQEKEGLKVLAVAAR